MSRPMRGSLATTQIRIRRGRTIKTQVLQDGDSGARKLGSARSCASRCSKVGRVCPATDGQQHLHLAVALLQEVELLGAPIHVGADIVPRVRRVVLLKIGVRICEVHLPGFGAHVGEGVEHVSDLVTRQVLGLEVASVDGLMSLISFLTVPQIAMLGMWKLPS